MSTTPPLPAAGPDYHRGLHAGRAAAKLGWAVCWLAARMLAEEAVYCPSGLSPEQQGYAAGLDETYPGGENEIVQFLRTGTNRERPYLANGTGKAPCPWGTGAVAATTGKSVEKAPPGGPGI